MPKINEAKKELWLSRIMACRQSGLPDVRWCKENNINPSTLYYWIKKLRFELPEVVTKNQETITNTDIYAFTKEELEGGDLVKFIKPFSVSHPFSTFES